MDRDAVTVTKEYTPGAFANEVLEQIKEQNVQQLQELYVILSEENDINKAKLTCSSLHEHCLQGMLSVIKECSKNMLLKYYLWHFFQLMTSCSRVKYVAQTDKALLPALIHLNAYTWDEEKQKSLKAMSINYIVFMLGGATDTYFDHVASTKAIGFLYEILEGCALEMNDPLIEPLMLALNLLLEGTSSCKRQLNKLNFSTLMLNKIYERKNCHEKLLKIANITYQKLLLLTSDNQSFVETFRKEFDEEARKHPIYQPLKCSNDKCNNSETAIGSYKRCSRCKTVIYCNKDCQLIHWKNGHSKTCAPKS